MNYSIKQIIKESRYRQYEIAAKIGISEYTFCKWFRKELTQEQRELILSAIEEQKAGEAHV